MSRDTRRFFVAFALLWLVFLTEFLWVHVRRAPEAGAVLRHLDLDLDLEPARGRARLRARLEIDPPPGSEQRDLALVVPAAASRIRVRAASGEALPARRRSHRQIYLVGRTVDGRRTWRLRRYAEPRLDIRLGRGDERALSLEYELEGGELRAPSSLRAGRTLLAGAWFPRVETAPDAVPDGLTFTLRVQAPESDRVAASGLLEGRETGGGIETSRWRSAGSVPDIWIAAAPLAEHHFEGAGVRAHIYVDPAREAGLAPQIGADVLRVAQAIQARAGLTAHAEWHVVALDKLGAIGRGLPPLVLIESGLFRRAAHRPGSRAERRGWIAQEMARAWLAAPVAGADAQADRVLQEALGSVLAQISLSGTQPKPGAAGAAQVEDPAGLRQRIDWMMRCRAYAGDSAPRPVLAGGDGRPAAGLLGAAKLPAALDALAFQMGDGEFLSLLTRRGEGSFLRRLLQARGGEALAPLLTQPWLTDLSIREAESRAGEVRVRIEDRGRAPTALRVAVRLEEEDGSQRLEWVRLPPGGQAEARFAGVRRWKRIEVDPGRRIFQIEFANDALPRARNPWAAMQRVWDARRWISLGEFDKAVQEARAAAEMDPELGEADYWAGLALVKLGRGAEAVEWLERARAAALDSDVVAAETLYLLGQAYAAAGERGRAADLYRQVVEEGWTSFSVERARKALDALQAGG